MHDGIDADERIAKPDFIQDVVPVHEVVSDRVVTATGEASHEAAPDESFRAGDENAPT